MTKNFTFPLPGGDSWNPPFHPIVQIFGWFVASLLSLETILGNAMVLLAYRLERSISKQLNNRFIISLAISDLIIGIEGIPFFTVYVINGDRWPLGAVACETWLFLDYTLCLVSILTVLLITADRYLSVCHTASYLKWQTPFKVQLLIIGSWLLPALIFGVMIFGWPLIGGELERIEATSNGECYAPFLANPYVNMSMYLAYYWTTLVAMLILYKGIHKAAKKLEKRSRAREHRHIALLLTQRLGTQVGVGLMLHAKRYHEETMREKAVIRRSEPPKDSGYITANTLSTTDSGDRRRSSFTVLVKAVQTTQRIARFRGRGATFAMFHSKNTVKKEVEKERMDNIHLDTHIEIPSHRNDHRLERLSELNSNSSQALTPTAAEGQQAVVATPSDEPKPADKEEMDDEGNCSLVADEEYESAMIKREQQFNCDYTLDTGAIVSLSTDAFNEESLSSVLHFNPSMVAVPLLDAGTSDTTSQIIATRNDENGRRPMEITRYSSLSYPKNIISVPKSTGSLKERRIRMLRTSKKTSPMSQLPPKCVEKTVSSIEQANLPAPSDNDMHPELDKLKRKEGGSISLEHPPPIKLSLPSPAPNIQQKSQRLSVNSVADPQMSSMSSALKQQSESRRSSQQRAQPQQIAAEDGADETGGMLGRFFQRIHSWVRISMVGLGGLGDGCEENNPTEERRPSTVDMLPSFLRSSKSYSSISSISSQTAGSRRHSSFLQTGSFSPQHIPALTITRGSICDDREPRQQKQSLVVNDTQAPSELPFAEDVALSGGKRGSRLLHSVFAPISALQRRRKRTKAERRAHKAFRTITFIVGLFAILWSPYYVVATIYGFCRGECIPAMLYNVSYYMCYLNSSLNPFAYALANRQFRSAFMRILRGNFRQL